jgi:hypothetical protein
MAGICFMGRELLRQARPSCAAGQARPQNHNNGFRSTRLLRQEHLRKSAANCKPTGQRAAQASQANGALGLAGLQNQNKRFLVILSDRVFLSEKVAFFRKNF